MIPHDDPVDEGQPEDSVETTERTRRSTYTAPEGEPALPDSFDPNVAPSTQGAGGTSISDSPQADASLPGRPDRRSIPADDIVRFLAPDVLPPGSTLEALEQLENQLVLREREALEFREWEDTMLSIGTPDALETVEQARTDFIDVISEPRRTASTSPTDSEPGAPPVSAPVLPGEARESEPASVLGPPKPVYDVSTTDELGPQVPAERQAIAGPGPARPGLAPSGREWIAVESSGLEPTALDVRTGRATRLFWVWFAANSSIISVVVGAALFSLGMSLRQAIVSTLLGVAISALPLGLGTLAGKWSGQPTMVVSRATFGHLGNIVPSSLALVSRVFWGAVLLWIMAAAVARILVVSELSGELSETQWTIVALAIGALMSLVIAFFGHALIERVHLVVTAASAALIVGFIVVTAPSIDIRVALTIGDGPWILVLSGAVIVFSIVGVAWANSTADLARYQRAGSSGGASMIWSTVGTTLAPFVLVSYGALLAASNSANAGGFLVNPVDTITELVPGWFPVLLMFAVSLSLISGVVLCIYSGAFALQAIGARLPRPGAAIVTGVAVAAVAALLSLVASDFGLVVRDLTTTLAVPIAAWVGLFASEMMIRHRRFDSDALLARGGVYPDWNPVNLGCLVGATLVGLGLTSATLPWLSWEGYLFALVGVPIDSDLAASDLGVFVALLIGIVVPIVAGVRAVRSQETGSADR